MGWATVQFRYHLRSIILIESDALKHSFYGYICVTKRILARRCPSISAHVTDLQSPSPSVGLSVGVSVRKVSCGKTAEWIRMPFEMVSGVGRGMGVFDGVVIVEEE